MWERLKLVRGDITSQNTEAVVNAANASLLGGGGVDGAIHRVAGPVILEQCEKIGHCDTGDAKITTGGNLPAPYVIHTVGPVYYGGNSGEAELLASCYERSLEVAEGYGLESVAFSAISCGVYGYPIEEAASIAIKKVRAKQLQAKSVRLVRFVLFSEESYRVFEQVLFDTAH